MKAYIALAPVAGLFLLAGWTRVSPKPKAPTIDAADVLRLVRTYRRWKRVTPRPIYMAPSIALWCMPPMIYDDRTDYKNPDSARNLPKPIPFAESPHVQKVFTVFVNEKGQGPMLASERPKFPEGSILVKEKYDASVFPPDKSGWHRRVLDFRYARGHSPELLTIMVKGKPGSNPSGGDWSYYTVDGTLTHVYPGSDATCISCHALRTRSDFTFRDYLPTRSPTP